LKEPECPVTQADTQQEVEQPVEEELNLTTKKKSKRKKEELDLLADEEKAEGEV
jgi:hypothetical protein